MEKRLVLFIGIILMLPILHSSLSTLSAQPSIARHGLTTAQYQQAFDDYKKQGYHPKMVTGYSLNNQANYAALWQKTNIPVSEFRNGLTAGHPMGAE